MVVGEEVRVFSWLLHYLAGFYDFIMDALLLWGKAAFSASGLREGRKGRFFRSGEPYDRHFCAVR